MYFTKEQKIGIGLVIGLITLFFTSAWKSLVEIAGWAGKFSELGWAPYMHHSRWGAIMIVASAGILYFRREKKWHTIAYILLAVGIAFLVHHLATVWSPTGDYAGGICK